MERVALYKRVIGLDVHQKHVTACAPIEEDEGTVRIERQPLGTFKQDRRELATWVKVKCPGERGMESIGIDWKSLDAALEVQRILAKVVNARHVKPLSE
jgi:hypothetical protein